MRTVPAPSPWLKFALESIMPAPLPSAPNVLAESMVNKAVNRLADQLIACDNAPYNLEGVALETMPESAKLMLINDASVIMASRNPRLQAIAKSRVLERVLGWALAKLLDEEIGLTDRQREDITRIVDEAAADALMEMDKELARVAQGYQR